MRKLTLALTMVTVASAGASTYLWQALGDEREQRAALQTRMAELERAAASSTAISQPDEPKPEPTQDTTESDVDLPPPGRSTPAAFAQAAPIAMGFRPVTPDPELSRRLMESHERQVRMLQDPEYRELVRSQQKLGMQQVYSDLEPLLGLTDDEANRLLDVLAEQSVRSMEERPMFAANGAPPSDAEMREHRRNFEEQRRRNETEIAAVLGPKYSEWQSYQGNAWSRSQVTRLRQRLAMTDEPLRQDQIKPLVDAIAREQKQLLAPPAMRSFSPGFDDPQAQLRSREEVLERTRQSHERIRISKRIADALAVRAVAAPTRKRGADARIESAPAARSRASASTR